MLEELATYLESCGLGEVGKTIFVDFMPVGTQGILLRSNPAGDPIDLDLPGFIQGSFILIARGANYEDTRGACVAAVAALEQGMRYRVQLGDVVFNSVRARTKPFTFPPVQGMQREFAVNLDVAYFDAA